MIPEREKKGDFQMKFAVATIHDTWYYTNIKEAVQFYNTLIACGVSYVELKEIESWKPYYYAKTIRVFHT